MKTQVFRKLPFATLALAVATALGCSPSVRQAVLPGDAVGSSPIEIGAGQVADAADHPTTPCVSPSCNRADGPTCDSDEGLFSYSSKYVR